MMTSSKWTVSLVAAWLFISGVSSVERLLPASWWFQPSGIRVAEITPVGRCPQIEEYQRDIHRPFRAVWVVTIFRQIEGNGFAQYRSFKGFADYSPDATLPAGMDLCWWSWGDVAALGLVPGRYRVNTLWQIDTSGGAKEVRRGSNIFEIVEE